MAMTDTAVCLMLAGTAAAYFESVEDHTAAVACLVAAAFLFLSMLAERR